MAEKSKKAKPEASVKTPEKQATQGTPKKEKK